MKSVISIKVRYPETDRMGIVYHARYYPWFELGRLDLMEKCGMTYAELEDDGILMPVTETHCKYIRSCTFGDEVTVETVLSGFSVVRCRFKYKVFNKGVLLAEGSTVHAITDKNLKALNIKKHRPRFWEMMCEAVEEEE